MKKKDTPRPYLFDQPDAQGEHTQDLPNVWQAAEEMVYPDFLVREKAVEKLLAIQAPKTYPLVAYLFATRILETDLDLRYQIVVALGNVLVPVDKGVTASGKVRQMLKSFLSGMRTREIYSLLELTDKYPPVEASVASLLNACSFGGNALAFLFSDRKMPLTIRKQAIRFSGLVGYLDTIPMLERLVTRLENRSRGQRAMAFAPSAQAEEDTLLDAARQALVLLKG